MTPVTATGAGSKTSFEPFEGGKFRFRVPGASSLGLVCMAIPGSILRGHPPARWVEVACGLFVLGLFLLLPSYVEVDSRRKRIRWLYLGFLPFRWIFARDVKAVVLFTEGHQRVLSLRMHSGSRRRLCISSDLSATDERGERCARCLDLPLADRELKGRSLGKGEDFPALEDDAHPDPTNVTMERMPDGIRLRVRLLSPFKLEQASLVVTSDSWAYGCVAPLMFLAGLFMILPATSGGNPFEVISPAMALFLFIGGGAALFMAYRYRHAPPPPPEEIWVTEEELRMDSAVFPVHLVEDIEVAAADAFKGEPPFLSLHISGQVVKITGMDLVTLQDLEKALRLALEGKI